MKQPLIPFIAILLLTGCAAQKAGKLHRNAILVDTHNDFISKSVQNGFVFDTDLRGKTQSDLNRMFKGGVDVQIFSIFGDETNGYAHANREIDTLEAIVARNQSTMMLVRNPEELDQAVREKKLAALMGMEGGHMIENDLSKLQQLYKRGIRYMTLTWNNSTDWASSAADESSGKRTDNNKGLTPFGVEVVRKMNELGMMVDLSHVGEQTFLDAIATSNKPVIASHSSVHHLCPVPRNLKDYQLSAIKANGGVVCVNFFSGFLDSNFNARNRAFIQKHRAEVDSLRRAGIPMFFIEDQLFEKYPDEVATLRPPLSMLIDHIDYIVKKIGINHVGLGSDFDGINSAPKELNGVEDFPKITAALRKRGYSNTDIKKILGENLLRVFRANQKN